MKESIISLITLSRTGWMLRGIPASIAESVASHSYLVALYTLVICSKLSRHDFKIDIGKAVSMAIVHDLPEAFIGDIISPYVPIYVQMKNEYEYKILSEKIKIDVIKDLFKEYIEQESIEAKIVKLADYLATLAVAKYYDEIGYRVDDIIKNMTDKALKMIEELNIDLSIEELLDVCK